ncbi:hypothetical protein V9T40_011200 [Parthenolecanium corni]|uniref:Uncharacterized protein n=1 Tax=Parthenolecanium corni TaxID=536013 RepID=A0AAN9T6F2_9HEMI
MSELIQMAEDIAKVKSIAIKSAEKISTLEERCERLQTTLNWFLSGHSITLPVEQTSDTIAAVWNAWNSGTSQQYPPRTRETITNNVGPMRMSLISSRRRLSFYHPYYRNKILLRPRFIPNNDAAQRF